MRFVAHPMFEREAEPQEQKSKEGGVTMHHEWILGYKYMREQLFRGVQLVRSTGYCIQPVMFLDS